MAHFYYYSSGSFLVIPVGHSSSMLLSIDYGNCIIMDEKIITNRFSLSHFFENLNNHFQPTRQSSPEPFIIITNKSKDNIYQQFNTVIFNSSIWFWYINISDKDKLEKNIELINQGIQSRRKSFSTFNAKEYIDYNLRLQSYNYLENSEEGHGRHVTPQIYSNELEKREEIQLQEEFEFLKNNKIVQNGEYFNNGVTLRILLIDDKIGSPIDCKAKLIQDLLELDFDHEKRKDVCWLTPKRDKTHSVLIKIVESYVDKSEHKNNTSKIIKELDKNKIQIIAVKSLSIARKLLSDKNIRCDLIMMDYLLAEIDKEPGEKRREYATEFWGNGFEKYFEISKKELIVKVNDNKYSLEEKEKYLTIKKIYDKIKTNRGPLQKLWIYPITAFNQTFIDDLRNKGIRLIDYYWYLSRGADPINTPYLFLNSLNKFLQLQLENAIFSAEELKVFLKKSIKRVKEIKSFDSFNAFMGSEYSVFVEKYMSRAVIYRDKELSLFACYIWNNFYSKDEFVPIFKLVQHIHKFYHRCAFGTQADFDKMVLYWRELKIFIENEGKSLDINDVDEFINVFKRIEPKP